MTEAPFRPTPLIDTSKQPEPDLRPQALAGERHTSAEFMAAEYKGAYLSHQERRVQYSHQTLDEYLDRTL